ncbi:MAG: MaoC/PaaZ C-terminal domain-containing protein, partial [Ancrocorticia sp.]
MELRQLAHVVHSSASKKLRTIGIPDSLDKIPTITRSVSTSAPELGSLADVFSEQGSGPGEVSAARTAPSTGNGQQGWLTPAALHSLCFPSNVELLADPTVPLQPLGTLVTSQAWDLAAPVSAGTDLQLSARVVSLNRDNSGIRVVIQCSLSAAGTVAYIECTSYLDKSGKGSDRNIGQIPELLARVPDLRKDVGTNGLGYLDVGQRTAYSSAQLGTQASKNWARITGDINPIHVSKASARLFGYRSVILHGAAIDAWAAGELGIDGSESCQGAASFRAPVLLPTQLELVELTDNRFAVLDAGSGRDLVHLWYSGKQNVPDVGEAIVLPRQDGRSSSTLVSQGMCAGAASGLPRLQQSIDSAVPWRKRYREAMEEMSWFDTPERGTNCAQSGLNALSELLHFSDGRTLSDAILREPSNAGGVITGTQKGRNEGLELSIDGRTLRGHELVAELDGWKQSGRLLDGADVALREMALDP